MLKHLWIASSCETQGAAEDKWEVEDRRIAQGINDEKGTPHRKREEVNAGLTEGVLPSGNKRSFRLCKESYLIGRFKKS
jgi:hypothetical protein